MNEETVTEEQPTAGVGNGAVPPPAKPEPVEPKHQALLDSIAAFVKAKGGKASKVEIHTEFPGDQEHQNLVNRLLTGETDLFVPSREDVDNVSTKFYSLK